MNTAFEIKTALIKGKIKEFNLSNWGYEFSKEEEIPENDFGLTKIYYYFINPNTQYQIEIYWYFDGKGRINGDAFELILSNLKNNHFMSFDIYSKKHDIKLVKLEKHAKGQDYKEFLDLYFNELVIACETYLNPFITGKEWEETPFDWTGIK